MEALVDHHHQDLDLHGLAEVEVPLLELLPQVLEEVLQELQVPLIQSNSGDRQAP